MSSQEQYFIGIDGGGTKCKARLQNSRGDLLGEGIAGPANPLRGISQAESAIVDAAEQALTNSNLPLSLLGSLYAGIGLAGVNLPGFNAQMQKWQHPFKAMHLTTDLHIACLGAHNGEDGAIIITGTGSSGASVVNQQYFEIGGHGFCVGDKGSGAWLGLMAINQSLEALDGVASYYPLVDQVLSFLKVTNAHEMVELLVGKTPAFFAQLSPVVMQAANAQDPMALKIVEEGAAYLSNMARRLLSNAPPRLSMIGGLAEYISKWLDEDVKQHIQPPKHLPEIGALLLARTLTQTVREA
ncbi:N-acetylglucosamine kinase [Neptunicella sp. SCSIO 80796]|uniref:N-acetylglucosamine kinase n=1 Tax=Neptunicella plasticusilytica TaxID=3117012 RepID=UPI003A4DE128